MLKKFLHEIGGGVKIHSVGGTPFPCYSKFEPKLRLSKNWKPCTTEAIRLQHKIDKMIPIYEDATNFGQKIKAKRIFKKALQISKRLTKLMGRGVNGTDNSSKEEATDAEAKA